MTIYDPLSPPLPPAPPPSPPLGSRFLVTGVGMSEGRVGVVEELAVVLEALVSGMFLRGLGV